MKSARSTPWMCATCGYMMDATTLPSGRGDLKPSDGDLAICINCGTLYTLCAAAWTLTTATEHADLPADLKKKVLVMQIARQAIVQADLTKRAGRA